MKKSKRLGRPEKLKRDRHGKTVLFRLTLAQNRRLRTAARKAGLSLSDYLRKMLRLPASAK